MAQPPRRPQANSGAPGLTCSPRWIRPALAAVVSIPFLLTGFGLIAAGLRPARQTVSVLTARPAIEPEVSARTDVEVTIPAPAPIEPGEARPPLAGMPKSLPEPALSSDVPAESAPILNGPLSPPRCDRFGTAIEFVRSPSLAFAQAAKERKLVMVLHLAGHFEDPGFT